MVIEVLAELNTIFSPNFDVLHSLICVLESVLFSEEHYAQ
jgi:hypothetical protein